MSVTGHLRGAQSIVSLLPPLALALLFLCGCSSTPQLMPTPNVYLQRHTNAFASVPAPLQTNTIHLLYATDRAPEIASGQLRYGYQRSASLAIGESTVALGDWLSWDELRAASLTAKRAQPVPLRVLGYRELNRYPETPLLMFTNQGRIHMAPAASNQLASARLTLQQHIQQRLALTPHKDVYVFVHGFNNTLDWAAALTAQLWHFTERQGVPIAYSWPAGRGGLRGYTYDRESGEFTIYHLKQFLRTLLDCPGIERIHLLAHSRGTDVLTTALREIVAEYRGPNRDAARIDRIANVVLLAPDLDAQVASQRIGAEHLELAVDRVTIYVCAEDRAINFANWFFEGVRRLGILQDSDFSPEQKALLRHYQNVHFIDARVKTDFISHGYFHSNPSVSSDLLLLLREHCDPGTSACRPLKGDGDPFWRITDGYPYR